MAVCRCGGHAPVWQVLTMGAVALCYVLVQVCLNRRQFRGIASRGIALAMLRAMSSGTTATRVGAGRDARKGEVPREHPDSS